MIDYMKELTPEQKAKWIKIFSENDVKTASAMYAIRSVAQHFVETENLIEADAQNEVQKNLPTWTPSNDNEIGEFMFERDQARQLHDETLIPMQRYSCIVMLFIVIERELRHLMANLKIHGRLTNVAIDPRGGFLEKTKQALDKCYGLKVGDCPHYGALRDLQMIRDCIIHCQGEVALSRDIEDLIKLNDKLDGFLAYPMSDIKLEPLCIKHFITEMMEFFIWVFKQLQQLQPVAKLNWKINPSDELQKLEQIIKRVE